VVERNVGAGELPRADHLRTSIQEHEGEGHESQLPSVVIYANQRALVMLHTAQSMESPVILALSGSKLLVVR